MKTRRITVTRLSRALMTGVALGVTIFATAALRAQSPGQSSTAPPTSIEPSAKISHWSKDFLQDAAQANKTEIAAADVALEKSQNSAVKSLGQTLRTDHLQNYKQLQTIADAYGVNLDSNLSWMNRRTVSRLQKDSDAEFDRDYTTTMIKDHVACIKTIDKAVAQAVEPDVKQYAETTLPTLRAHLRRSQDAARAVGVDNVTISSIMQGLPLGEPERGVTLNN
jgi:putative membrane protein